MAELFSLTRIPNPFRMGNMEEQMPCAGDPNLSALPEPERHTISDRKLAANRANAQLSTGPRTAAGKARSAMNSARHGIHSRSGVLMRRLVIPKVEGARASAEFRAMMAALIADRKPIGALEMLMVQEIGVCEWRLRRVLKYENRVAYLKSLDWVPEMDDDGIEYECDTILEQAGLNELSLPEPQEVATISRYENGLMRHLFRAIEQLDRLQRSRRAAAGGDPEKSHRTHRSGEIPELLSGK